MLMILTLGIALFVLTAQAQNPAPDIDGSRNTGASLPISTVPGGLKSSGISQSATGILLLDEGFDDITTLAGSGWVQINNSNPTGIMGWFQGNSTVFYSYDGDITAYIAANFNNTTGEGTISNWLISPEMALSNGDFIAFRTRTTAGSIWPDRLELRLSTSGNSTDAGLDESGVGDFTTLLLSVNPSLTQGGYPEGWTQYEVQLSGLSGNAQGRFALRYFVTNGGPSGANGNYIGIDRVQYYSNSTATPVKDWAVFMVMFLIAGFSVLLIRRAI